MRRQVTTQVTTETVPRARGLELGRAQAPGVRRAAQRYAAMFARRGEPGFDARAWAARFREAIGDLRPAALAEIEGVAEGAGLDPLEVVALNARTEILAKADPYGERELSSECSTVLVQRPGASYAAQTWDWYDAMADGWLVWRLAGEDGWVETVTEHGLLGKIGVSSRGVGVLLNILHHEADANDEVGLPVHLLARLLLDSAASATDAERICRETPVAASTSLTVLDRDGGRTVELFPGGPGVVRPVDDLLVRTNHFLSREGAPGCLTADSYPSSGVRFDTLDATLRGRPPAGPDDVLDALADHDPVGPVCRHPDDSLPPEERTATLATVVVEPAGPALTAYDAGPCGHRSGTMAR